LEWKDHPKKVNRDFFQTAMFDADIMGCN